MLVIVIVSLQFLYYQLLFSFISAINDLDSSTDGSRAKNCIVYPHVCVLILQLLSQYQTEPDYVPTVVSVLERTIDLVKDNPHNVVSLYDQVNKIIFIKFVYD